MDIYPHSSSAGVPNSELFNPLDSVNTKSIVVSKIDEANKKAFKSNGALRSQLKIDSAIKILNSQELILKNDNTIDKELKNSLLLCLSEEKNKILTAKAAITLQSFIRGKNAENRAVLPSQLLNALQSIPFLDDLGDLEKQEFSLRIARELQTIMDDPKKHNVLIRYSKNDGDSSLTNQPSLYTFYINVDPESLIAVVSLKPKKNQKKYLGKGGFKTVYSGVDIAIPLKVEANGRLMYLENKAIAIPKKGVDFKTRLMSPNALHAEIYEEISKKKLPGRITTPAYVREHVSKGGVTKFELIQDCYSGDLYKIAKKGYYRDSGKLVTFDYEHIFEHLEDLFQTIHSLSVLGYTHGDVKVENLLVAEEDGSIKSFLHDFDYVSKRCLGKLRANFYIDLAGQNGLYSPVTDIISSIVTSLELLFGFHAKIKPDHKGLHASEPELYTKFIVANIFKSIKEGKIPINRPSLLPKDMLEMFFYISNSDKHDNETRRFALDSYIDLKVGLKLLSTFKAFFNKEHIFESKMYGSCIAHFSGLSKEDYENLRSGGDAGLGEIRYLFLEGVNVYVIDEIARIFGRDIHKKLKLTEDEFYDSDMSVVVERLQRFLISSGSLSIEDFYPLYERAHTLTHLTELFQDIKMPAYENPDLFRFLDSENPQERQAGQQMVYQLFGSAEDLQKEIHQIRLDYLQEKEANKDLYQS